MNQVWLNITENHHTHYGQNNYMQQVIQVPTLCRIRNLTLVKSTQDKNITSSQTSRGSAPHRSGMRALLRISKPSVSHIEEEALSLSVCSTTVSY